jgi:cell division protein FtsL
VLVGGALGVVGVRVQQVRLAYQLDALRAERTRVEALVRQLDIEAETLRSPGRLESRARQLGMMPPGRDQVRLAREYVAAGSGLAAARRYRIDAFSAAAHAPLP